MWSVPDLGAPPARGSPSGAAGRVRQTAGMTHSPRFASVEDVHDRLAEHGYLASDAIATTVFLADRLGKPLLIEGPAGVGQTALSGAVAAATDSELVRLQCYESVDAARRLYEWNHGNPLRRI